MQSRTLVLPLKGFGAPPSEAEVTITELNLGDRLRRGLLVFGGGIGVALIALPIPIVHLILPPAALLGGTTFGVLRITQREVLDSAAGACPFCGTRQRFNLGGGSYRLPRTVICSGCRKALRIESDGSPGSE
jgi:hypothetical protein